MSLLTFPAGIQVGFARARYIFNETEAPVVSLCVELVDGELERPASINYTSAEVQGEGV